MNKFVTTWIISDTHWYHDAIQISCNRPINHTELSIDNLRIMVNPQDIVLHLGDVIFYQNDLLKGIMDSINGTKILLIGNHDRKSKSWYRKNGFAFVADMIVLDGVLYSHKPIQNLPSNVRLNVHGHLHILTQEKLTKYPWLTSKHKLFCLEEQNYKPVRADQFTKL